MGSDPCQPSAAGGRLECHEHFLCAFSCRRGRELGLPSLVSCSVLGGVAPLAAEILGPWSLGPGSFKRARAGVPRGLRTPHVIEYREVTHASFPPWARESVEGVPASPLHFSPVLLKALIATSPEAPAGRWEPSEHPGLGDVAARTCQMEGRRVSPPPWFCSSASPSVSFHPWHSYLTRSQDVAGSSPLILNLFDQRGSRVISLRELVSALGIGIQS